MKKIYRYDCFGDTIIFAESLGYIDSAPKDVEDGWDSDGADSLEEDAVDFIESKGYKVVGYSITDEKKGTKNETHRR